MHSSRGDASTELFCTQLISSGSFGMHCRFGAVELRRPVAYQ